jgi:thiamine-monophosphate kinase
MPQETGVDEFAIIEKYFAPLAKSEPLAFGLTDDAAVLRAASGEDLVVTTDTMVEGQHFREHADAGLVARKLLRVNLSDLAAKGATPKHYLLNAAFPKGTPEAWIAKFASGLAMDQAEYGVVLIGGDTTATAGPLCFTITAFGAVPREGMLRRNAARAGDLVFVSGTIGDAALALAIAGGEIGAGELPRASREALAARLDLPTPRVALGQSLRGLAHGSIDVSDGLVQDLGHIAHASNVEIVIDAESILLSAPAKTLVAKSQARLRQCLVGGDDYELAFTVSPAAQDAVAGLAKSQGVAITCIGEVKAGEGVRVRGLEFSPTDRTGFRHRF